jgi:ABC-type Fe3+ transport system permease subunit
VHEVRRIDVFTVKKLSVAPNKVVIQLISQAEGDTVALGQIFIMCMCVFFFWIYFKINLALTYISINKTTRKRKQTAQEAQRPPVAQELPIFGVYLFVGLLLLLAHCRGICLLDLLFLLAVEFTELWQNFRQKH